MGLVESKRGTKKYVSVVEGEFKMKVPEGVEGAKLRKYELPDGTKGEKWELAYSSLSGLIYDIKVKDGNYGKSLNIDIDGVIVSIGVGSPYFRKITETLPNLDLKKEVTLTPYDFEADGKKLKGISVKQDGEKIKSAFYDFDKKKPLLGMPQPDAEKVDDMGKDYWKIYFLEVDAFLCKYITNMEKDFFSSPELDKTELSPELQAAVDKDKVADEDLPF